MRNPNANNRQGRRFDPPFPKLNRPFVKINLNTYLTFILFITVIKYTTNYINIYFKLLTSFTVTVARYLKGLLDLQPTLFIHYLHELYHIYRFHYIH